MPTDPIIPAAPLADAAVEHLRLADELLADADADARLVRAEGSRHVDPLGYARSQAATAAAHAGVATALTLMELRDQLPPRLSLRPRSTVMEVEMDADAWDVLAAGLRAAQGRVDGEDVTDAVRYAVRLARQHPGARIALVAATAATGASALIAGPRGVLALLRHADGPHWDPDNHQLLLANGSRFTVYGADRPGRLRGPQHHYGIAYDRPSWPADTAEEAWRNLRTGARLHGIDPAHIAEVAAAWPAHLTDQLAAAG